MSLLLYGGFKFKPINMRKLIFLFSLLTSIGSFSQVADFSASSTTICVGGSVTFTNLSVGATSFAWTFIDGASSQTSTLTNPVISYNTPGTYSVILTASNSSTSDTEIKNNLITVIPSATITLTSGLGSNNQSVCANSPFVITYDIAGATGGNVTFTPLSAGATSSFVATPSGGTLTISGSPSNPFTYSVATTGGFCASVSASGSVAITPAPTLSLTSAPATANQTVCLNSNIATINYSFGGSATNVNITGLPPGVFFATTSLSASISGTPSTAGTFNYLVVTTGGNCTPDSLTGTIQVDSVPTLTLQTATATTNQSVCANDSITAITYLVGGSATGASVTGLPAGITGNFSSGLFTITGSSSVTGTHNYTVTTSGSGCPAVSLTGSIVISTAPTLSLSSAIGTDSQTVCLNANITTIGYLFGGSATNVNITGLPSGVFFATTSLSASISGTPSTVGTFNYLVVTTGGACAPDSLSGQIIVDTAHVLTLQSSVPTTNQTICANDSITPIIYAVSGSATGATVSGLPTGLSGSFSSGLFTISGSSAVTGTHNYTVSTTGGGCPSISLTGIITLSIAPTLTLTSASITDTQTVCLNSGITTITYDFGGGATNASVSGLPANVFFATSSSSVSISGSPAVVGQFNYQIETIGGACTPDTMFGQINVDTIPTLVLASAVGSSHQTICENSNLAPLDFTFGGGSTGATLTGLPFTISSVITTNNLAITGSIATAGTFPYTITTTGGTCPAITFDDTLFVQTAPTILLSSALLTDSQTICNNTTIVPIEYTFGGSATSITVIGLPNGLTTSTTGSLLTISGTALQAGTFNYTAFTVGGVCAPDTLTGTIVVESPFITLISPAYTNNQLICMNSPIDTIQYLISGVVSTFDLPIGASTSITAGAPDTLSIFGLPTTSGSYFYTIQYNGLCGNALVVGSLTILDTIVNNQIGNDTTVCHDNIFQFSGTTFTNTGVTAYNYSWENAPTATGPWTPAPGVNNLVAYSNNAEISVTLPFYRRIVTNGSCVDSSNVVQLSIDSLPTASNTIANYTICSNDTVNVSGLTIVNASPNGWSTTGSGVLQNMGGITPQYIPSLADAGTTVLLTYNVISNNSCSPQSLTGTIGIVVAPIPVALAGSSATICANGTEINIPGTQALNGIISWTTIGNGSLSDSTVLSPTYTTTLADTGDTLLFTMIVTDTSCTNPLSDTAQFQLFVDPIGINPAINAFAGEDVTIELGDSIQLEATGVAITTWDWSPGMELNDSTIFNPIASPIDTTAFILTVYDINGCIDTDTLLVNVIPISDFFIPNLFSPNGDGSNDFWEIPKLPYYPNTLVTIINREGMEVYRNANYDNSWDGKYDGKELPEATYYYYIKLATNDKVYKGAVTILRNK